IPTERPKGNLMFSVTKFGAILVIGVPLIVALGHLGPNAARPAAGEKDEPPAVRAAECRLATGSIKIDGILDEAAWEKAELLKDFAVYWDHRPAKTATKARLLWDETYLYFAAEMEDS